MGFWLGLLAEIFGWTAAEVVTDKTPRFVILFIFILIILILVGVVIYYFLI